MSMPKLWNLHFQPAPRRFEGACRSESQITKMQLVRLQNDRIVNRARGADGPAGSSRAHGANSKVDWMLVSVGFCFRWLRTSPNGNCGDSLTSTNCPAFAGTRVRRTTPIYAPLGSRDWSPAASFLHRRTRTCHASPHLPSHASSPCRRSFNRTSTRVLPITRRDAHHRAQPINDLPTHHGRPISGACPPGRTGIGLAVRVIAAMD